jgi:3-methylcrotonyl-CoA carboxylase alpha subunit
MFTKILIANRGEIACRVASTARRMGIQTVAVYSDADAQAKHVQMCDEAYRLGPASARESYLLGNKIIELAKQSGAQAIHPGYGFLSENEDFAQAVFDSGLVFIGPPPSAIRAMGLKAESKQLMQQAGVPLVPGYHSADQNPALLAAQAKQIGYPVLIKASAGGGGKGMRIVDREDDFAAALSSCQREAAASFGNTAVLVERYLTKPRHIEIQLFADSHGNCVYLFERDCSVQRRHQKVIEEAPAPGMSQERREAMGKAAVAAAQAVGYVGAGTVEFIAEPDGRFYFMEMNTRLQVEHPVTEMITGQDLVYWQLHIAAGGLLPLQQDQLSINGHAIEARIYAESPETGFLPSTGVISHLRTPPAVNFVVDTAQPVRIDSGVRQGDEISAFYDPMIAKLIVWAPDRTMALARLRKALQGYEVRGLKTNVDFLGRLTTSEPFAKADLDTGLIERDKAHLLPEPASPSPAQQAIFCAALIALEAGLLPKSNDPFLLPNGWRNGSALTREIRFAHPQQSDDQSYVAHVIYTSAGRGLPSLVVTVANGESICVGQLQCSADGDLQGLLGSQAFAGRVAREGSLIHWYGPQGHLAMRWIDPLAIRSAQAQEGGRLTAPMPGKVIALLVKQGDLVKKGQALLVMEAMKMEHTIHAPTDGVVAKLPFVVGAQVQEGAALLSLEQSA